MTEKISVNRVKKCPRTKDDRKFLGHFEQMTEVSLRKKQPHMSHLTGATLTSVLQHENIILSKGSPSWPLRVTHATSSSHARKPIMLN